MGEGPGAKNAECQKRPVTTVKEEKGKNKPKKTDCVYVLRLKAR